MKIFRAPKTLAVFGALFLCLHAAASAGEKESEVLDANSRDLFIEENGVLKNVRAEKLLSKEFTVEGLLANVEKLKEKFAKKGPQTAEEKTVVDEAQALLKRAGEAKDNETPEQAFGRFQSEHHETFVAALERYLAEFVKKAEGDRTGLAQALLPYVESLRAGIQKYLLKLDHMRGAIDVARAANGLPVEDRKR